MKAKELNNIKNYDEDDCELCELHSRAHDVIKDGIVCPHCDKIDFISQEDSMEFHVIGETNGSYDNDDEEMIKLPVFKCFHCEKEYILRPEKINHNWNHDVYYTGGKDYLNGEDDDLKIFEIAQKEIKKSLDQWVRRYEEGDKVDTDSVALWLKREITGAIAKYLYQKGLKK